MAEMGKRVKISDLTDNSVNFAMSSPHFGIQQHMRTLWCIKHTKYDIYMRSSQRTFSDFVWVKTCILLCGRYNVITSAILMILK